MLMKLYGVHLANAYSVFQSARHYSNCFKSFISYQPYEVDAIINAMLQIETVKEEIK